MKHFVKYKGYYGEVYYSEEDECYVGRVLGIIGMIAVHEDTESETVKELIESIDEYLESCRKDGMIPVATDPHVAHEMESYFENDLSKDVLVAAESKKLVFA